MTVLADRAIGFECEKCGEYMYIEYTLEHSWEDDRAVMADVIDCEHCNHPNRVIQEL